MTMEAHSGIAQAANYEGAILEARDGNRDKI